MILSGSLKTFLDHKSDSYTKLALQGLTNRQLKIYSIHPTFSKMIRRSLCQITDKTTLLYTTGVRMSLNRGSTYV